jgi:hypothetical protein
MAVELLTIAASGLLSAVTALGGVFLGSQLLNGREREVDRVARCRESADALLGSLRTLRDIARDSDSDESLHQGRWTEGIIAFGRTCDDHEHRLPDRWRHLGHSARAAVGEFAGGVAMSHIDKRMVDYPTPIFDAVWHDNAVSYLEYVIRQLQRWRDSPKPNPRRQDLYNFDNWLRFRAEAES